MPSVFAPSNVALITGGASGVGLAVAQLCRKHGMKLALVDNNVENLARAKETLGSAEKTETYEMDVGKVEEWKGLREKVERDFGGVDLLHLNAGVGLQGGWGDTGYFEKTLETNLFGYIHGITTFLPVVQRQTSKPTAIILTGSKQGITNPPGNPAYNASKAAVKTLAEHLSYDLRATSTSVHLLIPGWTFTGLSGGGPGSSKQKPEGAWTATQVAEYLEKKMGEGQFWVVCPDGDVTEEMDRKRMLWGAGDAVYGRKPLSRWREEYKGEVAEWMGKKEL